MVFHFHIGSDSVWLSSFFWSVSKTNVHICLYSYKLALKSWVSSVTQRLNELSIAQAHRICRWRSLTFIFSLFTWMHDDFLIWEISILRQVFCTLCLLHYSEFFFFANIMLNHAILILMRGYRCQPMALWNLNYRYIILTCGISIL